VKQLLCRLGLAFADPVEEREFFAGYVRRNLVFARFMLFLGSGLFIMFVAWDRILDPVGAEHTLWIRVALLAPAISFAGAILYWKAAQRVIEPIVTAAGIVATGCLAAVCAILHGGIGVAAGGINLVVLFVFAILPMRTLWYVGFCVATTISYFIGQSLAQPFAPGMPYINVLMLGTAMLLGGCALVAREKDAREQFRLNRDLSISNHRISELLHSMLPADIVRRIQSGESQIADLHKAVSIVFSDLVGFTELSSNISASRLVELLNRLFSEFDRLADKHGMHKIKTIGDAYMAVGGLLADVPADQAARAAASFALDMHKVAADLSREVGLPVQIRVGVHVGAVVAGVIGTSRPAFDCWGEAVNLASRLESAALPGAVMVSERAYYMLRNHYDVVMHDEVDLKGIGRSRIYTLRPNRVAAAAIDAQGRALGQWGTA
jgi:class 3 adenylate cyclase